MTFNFSIEQFCALMIAIICGITDFRTTKIPNVITFPATLAGLVIHGVSGGWPGLLNSLAGAVIGVAITWLPKFKKEEAIAFGDVKLMMAMGAFLGWVEILLVWFYFSLVWGLIAVYRFVSVLPLKSMLGSFFAKNAGGSWFTPETNRKIQERMQSKIPIGPAIAAGVFLAIVLHHPTLQFMGFE